MAVDILLLRLANMLVFCAKKYNDPIIMIMIKVPVKVLKAKLYLYTQMTSCVLPLLQYIVLFC